MPQCEKKVWNHNSVTTFPWTEPHLPLTLLPHEAYSTVIIVDAGEDLRNRSFFTPISVTANVGVPTDT